MKEKLPSNGDLDLEKTASICQTCEAVKCQIQAMTDGVSRCTVTGSVDAVRRSGTSKGYQLRTGVRCQEQS